MAAGVPAEVSYRELLLNPTLATLFLTRTLDPIATTSIFSYMFSQLKWMSPTASDVEIATQAGLLTASKTSAKVCTNLLWGRLSDRPYGGRRMVLLFSLLASCMATIGYGFSTTFTAAVMWQIFNGSMSSTIGIIRCMTSEIETRPKYRSRALLMLSFTGSIGQLVGPLMGGFLTSPQSEDGNGGIFSRYPFALPNLVLASFYSISFVACYFAVDETLETFDKSKGSGFYQSALKLWNKVSRTGVSEHKYTAVSAQDDDVFALQDSLDTPRSSASFPEKKVEELTFWQIWTPQVCFTLLAHFLIAGHIMTFNATWSIFIASPVLQDRHSQLTPISFTGGVGLDPAQIGTLSSTFALLGVFLQTRIPSLNDRFGTLAVWRTALLIFPFAYFIAPYAALVASEAGRIPVWAMLSAVNLLFVVGKTGAQPAMALLINNAVPAPTARGTVNVAGTVVGNLSRSIVPIATMALYGWGYEHGYVVAGFWAMTGLSVLAIVASGWVKTRSEPDADTTQTVFVNETRTGEARV